MVRFAQIVKSIRREELELAIEERRARSDEGLPQALAPPPDWQVMGLPGGAPRMAVETMPEAEMARPAPARPAPATPAPAPPAPRAPLAMAAAATAAAMATPAAAAVKDDDFLQSLDALAKPKPAPAPAKVEDTSVVDSLLDEMVAEEPAPEEEAPTLPTLPEPAEEPDSMDEILARMGPFADAKGSAGNESAAPPKPSARPEAARPQAAKQAAAAAVAAAAAAAPAEPADLGGLEDEWAAALGDESAAPAKDDSFASLESQLSSAADGVQVGSDAGSPAAAAAPQAPAAVEDDPFADLKAELDAAETAPGGSAAGGDDLLASLGIGAEEVPAAAADDPFAALDAELGGGAAGSSPAAPAVQPPAPAAVAAPAKPAPAGGMDDLSDLLGAASDPDAPGVGAQEAEALKETAVDKELEAAAAAVGSPEDLFAGEPEDIGALLSGGDKAAKAEEPQGDGLDDLFASTPEAEAPPADEAPADDALDEEPIEEAKPKADPNSPEAFASPEDIFG